MSRALVLNIQPTGAETHYRVTVVLEASRWRIDAYTNTADERWYIDVANDDGSAVVRGIAMVADLDMLAPYRYMDMPPGVLVVDSAADPGLDSFRLGTARLLYLESV